MVLFNYAVHEAVDEVGIRTELRVAEGGELELRRGLGMGGGRRMLTPFQVCLACRCCVSGSEPAMCSTMPCCFGIDCQLPNKPFGVCALVPKTCTCTSCAI
ncbi:hypothetical protein M9H77_22206 [Catharanthus roseus]|uniref:Uncharacterized protein n=1 Tax=Catharanthus roseus TaxID=4058 RepID=A0ACC0ASG1_CATRO|nr:hypothetical protein M9H77_22206 [Catharanthus roseus]